MLLRITGALLLILNTFQSLKAEPKPLVIDQSQKKTSDQYIRAAHDVINHNLSLEQVRFNILQATLADKTAKWLMEEDSENYFIFRWDYSKAVLYVKVEYNKNYVQLKYADKADDFRCTNNIEGICYKNKESDYYSHLKRLKNIIQNSVHNAGASL